MLSSVDINWYVFRQLVPIVEDHDDVYLESDAELRVLHARARVKLREKHVGRDLDVFNAVSVRNLNVLHLGCLGLFLERLDSDELNLQRLDVQLRVSLNDMSVEGLKELAIGREDQTVEFKFGNILRG